MTTYFVTRHIGAIEWAARKGLRVDRQVAHLNPADIQPGD
ncbi:MAG: CRISPR-associated protein Csx16, partial [Halothiobacillaceae bacterium]